MIREAIIGAEMQALAASEGHRPALPDMSWSEPRPKGEVSAVLVRECAERGMSKKEAAAHLGFSLPRVYMTAKRNGITFPRGAA